MILHFHAADVKPGEIDRINLDTSHENYNTIFDPDCYYIEVTRNGLFKILQECDFNCYWYEKNLTTEHHAAEPTDDTVPFH